MLSVDVKLKNTDHNQNLTDLYDYGDFQMLSMATQALQAVFALPSID